ncbi:hypothetical protein, partial [Micromonospora globispora]|uniref:hypothetical protein n=1 Tax=Micromonospora globispora TaxID=1450148 RepID=UPI001FAFBCD4
TRPSSRRTVQLRREERRRGLQDLVRPPQLTHLPFQRGEAFRVSPASVSAFFTHVRNASG